MPPTHIQRFEYIRDKKNIISRNKLVNQQADIRARFIDYETRFAHNTLAGIPASPLLAIKDELRSCYGRNSGMKALQDAIEAAQEDGRLVWCPYCGITTPTSYDHYLPASEFPEFAAHALNIVPACAKCNSAKDDIWLTTGVRQFIHFYLDDIPVFPYLSVQLVADPLAQAVGAVFGLSQAGMPASIWAVMESHFRRLKLIERYNRQSNTLVNQALKVSKVYLDSGGHDAALFLENLAADQANLFGSYDLRAVLWRAMSADPDLPVWIGWL
ncbi:HNH endonuclease [Acetobacter sp. P5B1]|uniref:HNH endonuclease n=1 Tax=Acetobacter sp. P5B1 TaxID=2762620 RepID=UPI001C0546DD|nr:hypothetical protein [Acetobacter sp. P5B1]